jgi:hypothetical protein
MSYNCCALCWLDSGNFLLPTLLGDLSVVLFLRNLADPKVVLKRTHARRRGRESERVVQVQELVSVAAAEWKSVRHIRLWYRFEKSRNKRNAGPCESGILESEPVKAAAKAASL